MELRGGLSGTATATIGILNTTTNNLTMDIFEPIAGNASGIVELTTS